MPAAPETALWRTLETLAVQAQRFDVARAFADDPQRFEHFSWRGAGVLLDLSHQKINAEILSVLLQLPQAIGARDAIEAMFCGEPINTTERRAALHVALRQPVGAAIGGAQIEAEVLAERSRMLAFADALRTSGRFDTVINIGIGGSDLGPAMAVRALARQVSGGPRVCFVSNVDGTALADQLVTLDPARTFFIVCSKTFTTPETMANAEQARAWIKAKLGEAAVPAHFAAVSVNAAAMDAFGIDPGHRFRMWDWVGGRFSVWSSIGLALAVAIGAARFEAFLAGAHAMDQHYRSAAWGENLPVLAALTGLWNINLMGLGALAILPYTDRLGLFPAFLQQLEMESNGKRVSREGRPLTWSTAPIVFGEPANNAQHSFFQMLHQGSLRAALDVILVREPAGPTAQHQLALANGLAQIEAFTVGQAHADPHRVHEGSRPLSVILLNALTPESLGALIALYEHKVHLQGLLWGVNSFDQFGVELGKRLVGAGAPASVRGLQRALGVV
ncbi:MAG: glucose-6-phosphate isomerase [Steroidobacteraceae bacterium]